MKDAPGTWPCRPGRKPPASGASRGHRGLRPGGPSAGSQGFGLLEVLVATTVMGLVLVVLLQVLSVALRAQEKTQEQARALQVAEQALQEACSAMNLSAAQYQGETGPYKYSVKVTPQYELSDQTLDSQVRCSLIQVTVSWEERGSTRSVSLETIRTAAQRRM